MLSPICHYFLRAWSNFVFQCGRTDWSFYSPSISLCVWIARRPNHIPSEATALINLGAYFVTVMNKNVSYCWGLFFLRQFSSPQFITYTSHICSGWILRLAASFADAVSRKPSSCWKLRTNATPQPWAVHFRSRTVFSISRGHQSCFDTSVL